MFRVVWLLVSQLFCPGYDVVSTVPEFSRLDLSKRCVACVSSRESRRPYDENISRNIRSFTTNAMLTESITRASTAEYFFLVNWKQKNKFSNHKKKIKRSRKRRRQPQRISKKTIVIMSSHSGSVRVRVLYMAEDIIAGKAWKIVIKEGKDAPINFHLVEWRKGEYFLLMRNRNPRSANRYIVANEQLGGLRVCQSSTASGCRRKFGNQTITTANFKLLHMPRSIGPIFTYQWVISFDFGTIQKYLKIEDSTGEAVLTEDLSDVTRFMFILNR